MNQKQLFFNSILFNQVPAGEALKKNKQNILIDKINVINSLLLEKNLKFPVLVAKVNKVKNTIYREILTNETETNSSTKLLYKDKTRKKLIDTIELNLNESKYIKFKNFKDKSQNNTTLRSEIYIKELINSGRSSVNKSINKNNISFPLIKRREFSFDAIKINHINDQYKKRETLKDILEVEKLIVKPFKYK